MIVWLQPYENGPHFVSQKLHICFHFLVAPPTIKDSLRHPPINHNSKHKQFPSLKYSKSVLQSVGKMQNWEQRHTGLVMAKLFMEKLKRFISELPSRDHDRNIVEFDEDVEETKIPKDVKEGHFAVIAVKGGKSKRFILELSYLRNPAFLRLLEQAKEEYGFKQMGALTVPCQPEEIQMILEDKVKKITSL